MGLNRSVIKVRKYLFIVSLILISSSLQGFQFVNENTWSVISEKNDYVEINQIKVETIPQWEIHYEKTKNGEPANTIVGIKIQISRKDDAVDLTFIPMVKVIVDSDKIRNPRMLMAAHKGEFQHYVDVCLCWKNIFTPFATRFVGTKQNLNLVKKVCVDYFHSKMNQTRVFWDESGNHNVNSFGFKNQPTQTEIDAYRMEAYGEIFPYNDGVEMYAKSDAFPEYSQTGT